MAHEIYQDCIEACLACAQECEHCGDACIGMTEMANCVRTCRDCSELCWVCSEIEDLCPCLGTLAQDLVDCRAAHARLPGDVADLPSLGPQELDPRLQFWRDLDPPALLTRPTGGPAPGGLLPGQDALRRTSVS